jgi:hypothetical protein
MNPGEKSPTLTHVGAGIAQFNKNRNILSDENLFVLPPVCHVCAAPCRLRGCSQARLASLESEGNISTLTQGSPFLATLGFVMQPR